VREPTQAKNGDFTNKKLTFLSGTQTCGLEMPQELWIIRNDKFLSQPCFEDKHHKTLKKNRNMREMPTFLVHHDFFPGRLLTIWDWPHFKERI